MRRTQVRIVTDALFTPVRGAPTCHANVVQRLDQVSLRIHGWTYFACSWSKGPEGLPAGVIAEKLGVANSTLSFHLKELAHAKVVTSRQDGRFIYYSANFRTMNGLMEYLTDNCCRGVTCDISCAPVIQRKRKTS